VYGFTALPGWLDGGASRMGRKVALSAITA
jgi:hypothetical protein